LKVNRGSIEGAIEVQCAAKTNGFQFDFHWKTFQLPLENDLISIGKRFDFHWKTQRVGVGCVAKTSGGCREGGFDGGAMK
jgi:hypothetical protein